MQIRDYSNVLNTSVLSKLITNYSCFVYMLEDTQKIFLEENTLRLIELEF